METLHEIVCFFLLILEGFLAMAHAHIVLSLRALPLKDVATIRTFFLFATLTVATSGQVVDTRFWVLDLVIMLHNLYCYLSWDHSNYTKKIMLWSSLNWTGSRMKNIPLSLGALCAAFVHGHHAYLVATQLDLKLLLLGLIGIHSAVMAVMYNSRLAWASPANIPGWVAKRVTDSITDNKSMKHD